MPEEKDHEVLIQLAEMRQQMLAVSASVEDIKKSVKQVLVIDKTISEHAIHLEQTSSENSRQWGRIDAIAKAVETTSEKVDAWVNKGRGAWLALTLLGSAIQAMVFGSVIYVFSHLRSLEDTTLINAHRLTQLEYQHKHAPVDRDKRIRMNK